MPEKPTSAARQEGRAVPTVTLVDPKTGRQSLWRYVWPRDRAGLLVMGTLRATPDGTAYAYNWFRALSNLYVAEGLD